MFSIVFFFNIPTRRGLFHLQDKLNGRSITTEIKIQSKTGQHVKMCFFFLSELTNKVDLPEKGSDLATAEEV